MAAIDLNDFLHSLARYLAARAAAQDPAVSVEVVGTPRAMWRNKAVEDASGDPVAGRRGRPVQRAADLRRPEHRQGPAAPVLGPVPDDRHRRGRDAPAAQVLFECLLFAPDDPVQPLQPLRMTTVDGYRAADDAPDGRWLLISVDPTNRPGKTGVDPRGRPRVTFNFDVGFAKLG